MLQLYCHGKSNNPQKINCYEWKIIYKLRLSQDGHHFADKTFQSIFFHKNYCILIQISLKFIYSQGYNLQYVITGSDNGLAPIRGQAFVWTNGG